ncbi:RNA polymerase sigma-I factor [Mechercharimyces sp. CAU 1602]|uniref:RNA polymerase sigma-I factor n=1 Tax=Mechercharimyces sp. CAU 1602 TaxID=2973933 RepID=UPI0021638E04|nr:RNA polymerase sigma-I factor [Mechercharimyces sp. CAU 1602]MCS1351913.1 RNA polymerase sigma-I factor [Mechercharimyces sp. CAU 1602]
MLIPEGEGYSGQLDGIESAVIEAQTKDSPYLREELLRLNKSYILRVASRICSRSITQTDDEYSIALTGFDEAITNYTRDQNSSFQTFSYMVIRRRLIDYYRSEQKHRQQVHFTEGHMEDDGDPKEIAKQSMQNFQKEEESFMRRLEIEQYSEQLSRYGIAMKDLVKISPKHRDTRATLFQYAERIVKDKRYLKVLLEKKRPAKELAPFLDCHRRTISRHRKYLVALTIILTEDLPMMRDYLGFKLDSEGGWQQCEKGS